MTKEKDEIKVKPTGCEKTIVFHKHIKQDDWKAAMNDAHPRVSIPCADIMTISESHIDGTTLIRTYNGGTVAVEESFEDANKMWNEALKS